MNNNYKKKYLKYKQKYLELKGGKFFGSTNRTGILYNVDKVIGEGYIYEKNSSSQNPNDTFLGIMSGVTAADGSRFLNYKLYSFICIVDTDDYNTLIKKNQKAKEFFNELGINGKYTILEYATNIFDRTYSSFKRKDQKSKDTTGIGVTNIQNLYTALTVEPNYLKNFKSMLITLIDILKK